MLRLSLEGVLAFLALLCPSRSGCVDWFLALDC